MRKRKLVIYPLSAVVLVALTGCLSKSISGTSSSRTLHSQSAQLYGRELSEQDVLGLSSQQHINEADIARALDATRSLRVKKGSKVMLIQSGARVPDPAAIRAFEEEYEVTVFTGIAATTNGPNDISKALRLAAAKSQSEKIICLWGKVEAASRKLETKVVSWVPIVGQIIPDKAQRMRIQLKVAIIDVRSGSWDIYSSKTFEDTSISASISRQSSEQGQIESLKKEAYKEAAKEFAQRYSGFSKRKS